MKSRWGEGRVESGRGVVGEIGGKVGGFLGGAGW